MNKAVLALSIAGAVMALATGPAAGNEQARAPAPLVRIETAQANWLPWSQLEQVAWLGAGGAPRTGRSDLMFGPRINMLQPFLLHPAAPATQFSSVWRIAPRTATE